MIRHWAHALDDMNPVYLDPEFAAASRFGGIVSSPVMLQTWTMPAPKLEGIGDRGGAPIESTTNPTAFLDEAGYTSTVATNSEFEIERYPRLGDVVSATAVYESVSDEKKTAPGTGDQPGHRVLLERAARAQTPDPALHPMWIPAQPAPPDVPQVPLPGLG